MSCFWFTFIGCGIHIVDSCPGLLGESRYKSRFRVKSIMCSLTSINFQALGKASSPLERTTSSSKKILYFKKKFFIGGHFGISYSRVGFTDLIWSQRDGEYKERPTFVDFVTILTEASMHHAGRHSCKIKEYRLPSPPSFKCNVLRESLSVDSQNIYCTTVKRRDSWVISVYLCLIQIYNTVFYREKNVLRELNKAYVGFSNRDCAKLCAVATGTGLLRSCHRFSQRHIKRQATRHDCLPSLLGDGDKWTEIVWGKKYLYWAV